MNLLGAALYDPSTAGTKATSALLAMTAVDTTNLRVAVTVPAHGMLRFHMMCAVEGATTFPAVLLGVLNGASVIARVSPKQTVGATALATTRLVLEADFTATGLSPGAMNCDAAYGVEIVVAATNIKYGGPNNTTTDDAWGAFVFEVWDPRPLKLALDGGVNITQILGTAISAPATAGILDVNVKNIDNDAASASGTVTFPNATLASTTNITAAAGCAVSSLGANVLTAAATAADFGTEVAAAVWQDAVAGDFTVASSIGKALYVSNVAPGASGGHMISGSNAGTTTFGAFTVTGAMTAAITGNITGNLSGSVGSVTGAVGSISTGGIAAASFAAGAIDATAIATDAIGANEFSQAAADKVWSTTARILTAGTNIQLPSNGLANVTAWTVNLTGNLSGSVGSVTGSVGSVTGLTASNLDATVSSRATPAQVNTEADTALSDVGLTLTVTGRVDAAISTRLATAGYTAPDNASVAAIKLQTDNLPTDPADQSLIIAATNTILADTNAILVDTGTTVPAQIAALNNLSAGDILTTALTEAYASLGAAPTLAELLFEVRALLAEKAVAGTTLTTKKIDGTTTAATYTLNDATSPTAIARAA